ncbi:precorrin-6A reductase [Oscillospiraceae bacterium MB08-C2-2]|nr:precorrin-6A reductase [Oscillospiraceae bacterium MB08-C2-2]
MKNLLIFAGTTEGRALTQRLAAYPVHLTVCVATDYGRELLPPTGKRLRILTERLDCAQMEALMRQEAFACVVDATHPYADEATRNIAEAARRAGVPYLRLLREQSMVGDCLYFSSLAEAVEGLEALPGNILAATGSKELELYTRISGFESRVYPRVLPTVEALEKCRELGFARSNIIAMQGPFSIALNKALLEQYSIGLLVTKDGGPQGGFAQKQEAAEASGARLVVIGRPTEGEGLAFEDLLDQLLSRLEVSP